MRKASVTALVVVFVIAIVSVLMGATPGSLTDNDSSTTPELNYSGLVPGEKGGPCEGSYQLKDHPEMCTHGPDPFPRSR